jgi:NAD(P)-dependent dehydrogenase (short-subunit alcohol dehydrogenase family)
MPAAAAADTRGRSSDDLTGRVALVTGAAHGLGREIAGLFVKRGARVVIADLDAEGAQDAAGTLGGEAARAVACDVTSSDEVAAAVETATSAFGGLDVLVNNAGVEIVEPLFEQSEEEFWRLMEINVKGVWLGMKHALPALTESRGSIVNMASIAGIGGAPLFGSYCASKAGVVQLTRVAALELREVGIRVNAVCPGFVGTAMVERLVPAVEALVGMPFEDVVNVKQGRLGTPAEVAEMVAFLASDEASFTTGAHYVLDGGLTGSLL